jgi:Domain of unknown function (DUF4419)
MQRFRVDAVVSASDLLPVRPLGERYHDALAIGGDPATPVIDHGTTHPLLAAVGIAFAQHRPLVLSPDAVWLTIAQGVAQHVRLHAEELRGRLVRHEGRKRLTIVRDAIPDDAQAWASAVVEFRGLLADEIGSGRARLFECDFSTSTEVERLASQIVLLDAYSPYFSYWMTCVCGIPEITLLGTVEDWRRIRARLDVIAELDLGFWCRSLVPIVDQFVRAASGKADVAFWRRIYMPVDAYGGDVITGWITRLYPYIKVGGKVDTPNPMLELAIDEPKNRTSKKQRTYSGPGISGDTVPASVSRVTVRIVDLMAREIKAVALVAGVTAVVQDGDGSLRPIAGWHLEDARVQMGDVVERILAEHHVVRPDPDEQRRFLGGPAEVLELYSQIEAATLFKGPRAWQLRSPREHQWVHVAPAGRWSFHRIADLPAGMSLCFATGDYTGPVYWVLCRLGAPESVGPGEIRIMPERVAALDPPSQIRVLGTSLAAILDAALVTDGEIDHLEVGRLSDLMV